MTDMFRRLWMLGAAPKYHKIEPHSRNASLDMPTADQRSQRTIQILQRWLVVLSVLLTTTLLALGTNIALQNDVLSRRSPVPALPSKAVTFQKDDLFASPASVESDRAWDRLMPQAEGFVLISQPDRYGLPPGMSTKTVEDKVYDIAAFHSLHCLTSIRQYLWQLKFSVDRNATEQVKAILLDPQEEHVLSCFDYLRQSIMCSADTTVEWPREDADGRRTVVDGWGVAHQCVDWDALLRFVKENTPH